MNNQPFEQYQQISATLPREFRHALQAHIATQVPVAISQKILLSLSESITNIIEHGDAVTHLGFRFSELSDGWELTISDNGNSWDPTQHLDDNLLTEFCAIENGRGIALIHAQSDQINYFPGDDNKVNELQLFWAFPKTQKRQTILIVEDNNSLRLLYKTYLDKSYDIITAINGYQALELLATHNIDLVLSDIKMPQMNGLSLRKKINQQPGNELIPFVFLTAQDDDLVQEQAVDLGIDDYLIKPVQKAQLLKVSQRILGRSKQVYQKLTTRLDKQITDSLKPTIPSIAHGWKLQVASRNTGSGGGDLLLHRNFNAMTQLLLTDIMGHDASAKFFSHAYGGYLHGLIQSMQDYQAPSYLLEQLSNSALDDNLLSKITLTCCSIQLSNAGIISIASAGHPAPLLISEDKVSAINTSGVLPGLLKDCQYEVTHLTIESGQRIALFTDGLFDSASNNQQRFELQQKITESLLTTLALPIDQAINHVMALFDELTAAQPSDDTLLLLLEPI